MAPIQRMKIVSSDNFTSGVPGELNGFEFKPMEEDNGNPVSVPQEFGIRERAVESGRVFSREVGEERGVCGVPDNAPAERDVVRAGAEESQELQVSDDGAQRADEGSSVSGEVDSGVLESVQSSGESESIVRAGSPGSGRFRTVWMGTVVEQSAFSRFLIGLAFTIDRILWEGREHHPAYRDHLDLEHEWFRRF
jgi:hypothetical protein